VRGIARRLRSSFGMRSARMTIRSQMAWYWRYVVNAVVLLLVAGLVWWVVQNSARLTGFDSGEAQSRIAVLAGESDTLKRELEAARSSVGERDRQLQIEKASQTELARAVAQLQDENATLKEDLGFLRNIMSSGTAPEGVGLSNLKIEPDGNPQNFRYRMLLTQGGQRKQDFKGRVQVVAHVQHRDGSASHTFPEASAGETAGAVEFRIYQKVEGRFRIPDGSNLKSVDVRVLAQPGGQVKLSRTLNMP